MAGELAEASGKAMELMEDEIPVSEEIRELSGILGLDPLTMGNEGKMMIILPEKEADRPLHFTKPSLWQTGIPGRPYYQRRSVHLITAYGGKRKLLPLRGEGLPRIC